MSTIIVFIILLAAGVALMTAKGIPLKVIGLAVILFSLYCIFALLV